MLQIERLEDARGWVGRELGVSPWIEVTQAHIDAFAQATGDHQWIHVDVQRAAAGPFGATVAHGFLTLSLLPRIIESTVAFGDVRMGLNYGLDRVRFPAPLPSGSRVRGRVLLRGYEAIDAGAQLQLEVLVEPEEGGKPVCAALSIVRLLNTGH